jgi:hypothetical protein
MFVWDTDAAAKQVKLIDKITLGQVQNLKLLAIS